MTNNKIALITGANKGIGFACARQLGKMGYTVLIGARDESRGKEAAGTLKSEGIDAVPVILDITRQDTMNSTLRFIENEYGRLDVLVNNAGIFLEKGILPSKLDLQDLKETFEVNFFGIFALTMALLPLLRDSAAGRIVQVSSGQGSLTRASGNDSGRLQLAYNCSKAALNMMTIQLAKEFAGTPLKINSAAPGYTMTDMNEGKGSRTVDEAAEIIVRLATLDDNGSSGGYFEDAGEVPW